MVATVKAMHPSSELSAYDQNNQASSLTNAFPAFRDRTEMVLCFECTTSS